MRPPPNENTLYKHGSRNSSLTNQRHFKVFGVSVGQQNFGYKIIIIIIIIKRIELNYLHVHKQELSSVIIITITIIIILFVCLLLGINVFVLQCLPLIRLWFYVLSAHNVITCIYTVLCL
jgi:hypothetical protein